MGQTARDKVDYMSQTRPHVTRLVHEYVVRLHVKKQYMSTQLYLSSLQILFSLQITTYSTANQFKCLVRVINQTSLSSFQRPSSQSQQ